jgi:hypothetical protein
MACPALMSGTEIDVTGLFDAVVRWPGLNGLRW